MLCIRRSSGQPRRCALVRLCPQLAALLVFLPVIPQLNAHICGPGVINLTVGQSCPWRITADRTEVTTAYVPALTGSTNAVDVTPVRPFQSHHGDFTITGVTPGTAILTVNWSYTPTGASGTCIVVLNVFPPGVMNTGPIPGTRPDGTIDDGRLSLYDGKGSIPSRAVGRLVEHFVPAAAPKLLIFAECYGGNAARSPFLARLPNATILSATAPGQWAYYGGYHDDAARALRPGAGRTARDVHEAGSAGKRTLMENQDGTPADKASSHYSSEWPILNGAVAPQAFPLSSVSPTGPVRSRHIVVYIGKPDVQQIDLQDHSGITLPSPDGQSQQVTDSADRDAIKDNFKNETGTTVHSAGGAPAPNDRRLGQDGWDYSGTLDGLQAAIQAAATAIRNSPTPAQEQFILFVGDHGVTGNQGARPVLTQVPSGARSLVLPNFAGWTADHPAVRFMLSDPANIPGFSLWFDFSEEPFAVDRGTDGAVLPPFTADEVILEVQSGSGIVPLRHTTCQVLDLDGNDQLGTIPDEGLEMFFPLPESVLLNRLIDQTADLYLANTAPHALPLTEIVLATGSVAKATPETRIPLALTPSGFDDQGAFGILVSGEPGQIVDLAISEVLPAWMPWTSVVLDTPLTRVQDPTPPASNGQRFYRAATLDQAR